MLATYLYLGTLPFIGGIERGTLVPLVRPNEAILAFGHGRRDGRRLCPGCERRAAAASPPPLGRTARRVRPARHRLADQLDVVAGHASARRRTSVAVLPVCKLAGLLLLVRTTVRTPTQVLWCIRLIIGGAVGIAAVAILQILSIGPVLALLDTWWPIGPGGSLDARGSATLANPIATGDYIVIGLTLLVTSGVRGLLGR